MISKLSMTGFTAISNKNNAKTNKTNLICIPQLKTDSVHFTGVTSKILYPDKTEKFISMHKCWDGIANYYHANGVYEEMHNMKREAAIEHNRGYEECIHQTTIAENNKQTGYLDTQTKDGRKATVLVNGYSFNGKTAFTPQNETIPHSGKKSGDVYDFKNKIVFKNVGDLSIVKHYTADKVYVYDPTKVDKDNELYNLKHIGNKVVMSGFKYEYENSKDLFADRLYDLNNDEQIVYVNARVASLGDKTTVYFDEMYKFKPNERGAIGLVQWACKDSEGQGYIEYVNGKKTVQILPIAMNFEDNKQTVYYNYFIENNKKEVPFYDTKMQIDLDTVLNHMQ